MLLYRAAESETTEGATCLNTEHAAELFSKLSESAQSAIIDLIKSLLSDG